MLLALALSNARVARSLALLALPTNQGGANRHSDDLYYPGVGAPLSRRHGSTGRLNQYRWGRVGDRKTATATTTESAAFAARYPNSPETKPRAVRTALSARSTRPFFGSALGCTMTVSSLAGR